MLHARNERGILRGFTLIELMIVIAIIVILAAILVPNFLHARAEAFTSACEHNEKQIATAMEEYAVDHMGTYPTIATLTTPYLGFTPTDPVNGSAYTILNTSGAYGSYQIQDQGGHDSTTVGLHQSDGTACNNTCTTIYFSQNRGLIGLP